MLYSKWACSNCEWALFRDVSENKDYLMVAYQCTYPDTEYRNKAQKNVITLCPYKRLMPQEWELCSEAEIKIHEPPFEYVVYEELPKKISSGLHIIGR